MKKKLYKPRHEVNELLGRRLDARREELGWTMIEFGRQMTTIQGNPSFTERTLREYLQGAVAPSVHRLRELCIATGLSADYLLGLKDD